MLLAYCLVAIISFVSLAAAAGADVTAASIVLFG